MGVYSSKVMTIRWLKEAMQQRMFTCKMPIYTTSTALLLEQSLQKALKTLLQGGKCVLGSERFEAYSTTIDSDILCEGTTCPHSDIRTMWYYILTSSKNPMIVYYC